MRLRIKEICKKQGVLQKDIADKLGITDIALRASLKGNPTIGTLEKVASALNVHISELFEKDTPNDNTIKCPNCGTELEVRKKE
ncbi:helix-turn-helix domain-containing protein [Dysgonomonas mossii]|uniref:helix-turn-helix domain-containing protein n=1 Tax=Dysgonomonas mossii TaxID=163665 RepID=UPI0039969719